jgi:hypothetical protein
MKRKGIATEKIREGVGISDGQWNEPDSHGPLPAAGLSEPQREAPPTGFSPDTRQKCSVA